MVFGGVSALFWWRFGSCFGGAGGGVLGGAGGAGGGLV